MRAGLGEMIKKRLRQGFIFLHCSLFGENVISFRTFIFNIFKSESWKDKIVTNDVNNENMLGFVNTFDQYHHNFDFDYFFSPPVKLLKDLNLKLRSKFNHGFKGHGYLHCAVKALNNFKLKRTHEASDSQFLFQIV